MAIGGFNSGFSFFDGFPSVGFSIGGYDPATAIPWTTYVDMRERTDDGTNISDFADQSGSGNDWSQGTLSLSPTIYTNTNLDSIEVARFNNDNMSFSFASGSLTDRTIVFVGDTTDLGSATFSYLFANAPNTAYHLAISGTSSAVFLGSNTTGAKGSYALGTTGVTGTLIYVLRSGSVYVYNNGSLVGSATAEVITQTMQYFGAFVDMYAAGFAAGYSATVDELNALGRYYEGIHGVTWTTIT